LPVVGAIFTEEPYTSIEQVQKALSFNDRFDKLYPSDYSTSLAYITACFPKTLAQEKILADAVDLLNKGAYADVVKEALNKNKVFKQALGSIDDHCHIQE